jgi:cytochrome c oxidase subunit 3
MSADSDHFESVAQRAQAVRLALGVFLASETLLFTAILALVVGYRATWPEAFAFGVHHNTKVLGSINTVVLLTSSTSLAVALEMLRTGRRRVATALTLFTAACGVAFLAIKITEYEHHFAEGIYPGGRGAFFVAHPIAGLPAFWTLYFLATGFHGVHVLAGVGAVGYRAIRMPDATEIHRFEATALYWHFVDLVWLFLWPLFYLA